MGARSEVGDIPEVLEILRLGVQGQEGPLSRRGGEELRRWQQQAYSGANTVGEDAEAREAGRALGGGSHPPPPSSDAVQQQVHPHPVSQAEPSY